MAQVFERGQIFKSWILRYQSASLTIIFPMFRAPE